MHEEDEKTVCLHSSKPDTGYISIPLQNIMGNSVAR
jgi:hypothetical protein